MVVNARGPFAPVRASALVGVVLAGGEGRRMGEGPKKPLRLLGGKPMVAHVVERLRPQVIDVVVVANDADAAFARLGVPVIADPPDIRRAARREGRRLGPLAGILAGMEWAQRHHPYAGWILTAPADVPFLPLDLTVRLCGHMHVPEPDVLVVRHGRHREPSRRVGQFAERHAHAELRWPGDPAPFMNVNTPEELKAAEARLARARPRSRR